MFDGEIPRALRGLLLEGPPSAKTQKKFDIVFQLMQRVRLALIDYKKTIGVDVHLTAFAQILWAGTHEDIVILVEMKGPTGLKKRTGVMLATNLHDFEHNMLSLCAEMMEQMK